MLFNLNNLRKVTLLDGSEAEAPSLVGLRDRALMAAMTYTFARIGAVVAMRIEDYYPGGKRWWVRLHEKGGKRHEMPAHQKLEQFSMISRRGRHRRRRQGPPLPLGGRQDGPVDGKPDAPRRCLSDDPPANGRSRVQDQSRLPCVPCDRHHRLSRSRRHARKRAGDGRARNSASRWRVWWKSTRSKFRSGPTTAFSIP